MSQLRDLIESSVSAAFSMSLYQRQLCAQETIAYYTKFPVKLQ